MKGFSLAEVLLAVALAAVIVLTLVALSLTSLRGNQKATDLTLAQSAAHQWIEEELYSAQHDSSNPLWIANNDQTPYKTLQLSVGNARYDLAVYAVDVNDPSVPHLKRCRLRVAWWGGEQTRSGYGNLSTEVTRFVSKP
jgi:type II secretory pathway pseudopilin PulG